MLVDPVSMKALQNMIAEVETLISTTTPMPENSRTHCLELLQAAKALMNDMIKRAGRIH